MSATALRNSKEAFDNQIWGFNLGPRFPSIGLNRTDTFLSIIIVDHENLKLLRPKTKINKFEQFGPIQIFPEHPNGPYAKKYSTDNFI